MKKLIKKYDKNLFVLGFIIFIVIIFLGILVVTFISELSVNKIAIVKVNGAISLYDSSSFFSAGGTSAESIINYINKAEEDLQVKAIILEINSGGGTVVASKEIAKAVKDAEKPIIAWIREIGASGGYWVASGADLIVADEASMTGSIGVIGSYLEFSELFDKYGIDYERIVSGKYKDLGSPYKNLTKIEKEVLLNKINLIKELFIDSVKDNRDLSSEAVEEISTAELFLGIEAKNLGLVDILGSKEEAIFHAEKLANVSDSELITYVEEKSFFEKMLGMFVQSSYFMGRGITDSIFFADNQEVFLAK